MTSAAPIVGSSAAVPGKAVAVLRTTPDAPIRARPSQAMPAPTLSGSRARRPAPIASRAPSPSSQARVGSEKKAHGALVPVSHTPSTNDVIVIASAPIPMARTGRSDRRASSSTMAGQKR